MILCLSVFVREVGVFVRSCVCLYVLGFVVFVC